jgi:hypothetical protein
MAVTTTPRPPFHVPLTDAQGFVQPAWQPFVQALYDKTGGQADKVDAAYQAAASAAPASSEVVAGAGLQGGGAIGGNTGVTLYVAVTAVAMLPTSAAEGDWAYALNGRKIGEGSGSGTGLPVWWSNGAWYAVDSGAAVTA